MVNLNVNVKDDGEERATVVMMRVMGALRLLYGVRYSGRGGGRGGGLGLGLDFQFVRSAIQGRVEGGERRRGELARLDADALAVAVWLALTGRNKSRVQEQWRRSATDRREASRGQWVRLLRL